VSTPSPTKSVPVTTSTSSTSTTKTGTAIPTLASGVGQVFIPAMSGICGIVVVMVGGLLF
jgi:urea transporter